MIVSPEYRQKEISFIAVHKVLYSRFVLKQFTCNCKSYTDLFSSTKPCSALLSLEFQFLFLGNTFLVLGL